MPRMDSDDNDHAKGLAKLLLIGDGKVGKTHYAGMAAAAGLNVLYFDGDVGRPTLRSLPRDIRSRIYALDVADTLEGGQIDSKFIDTMQAWTQAPVFKWNDTQQRVSSRKLDKEGDELWEILPAKMDSSCVFVLDSWTGLSESMLQSAALAYSVDLSNTNTTEMRPVYQAAGNKSMQMLKCIRSMRCHVIVLSHPDEFSHTTKPEGQKVGKIQEKDLVVDWTKMIPKSTSKPNALQMAKYFTDIAWAETNATGSERRLNFRLDSGRVSGGHWSDVKSMEEYSFGNLVRHIGGTLPPSDGSPIQSWFNSRILSTQDIQQPSLLKSTGASANSSQAKVLDGTSQTAIKTSGSGMAALFGKG